MNPYFFYLSLIDILANHFCKTNQQRAILFALREMMICLKPEEWAGFNRRQRITWIFKRMPQDLAMSLGRPDSDFYKEIA